MGLVTSEAHSSVHQREHFTTSSSSHLDYLKDIQYHFDNSSRCTSTPTVTQTGPLTSNRGSPPRAQSHQYLEYLLRSTAEHSLTVATSSQLKPNSTPLASASATACTSTSSSKNFNNTFSDKLSTLATSRLSTTSTTPSIHHHH